MNKKILIATLVIVIISVIVLFIIINQSTKEKFIKGNENLYDIATQNIIDNYESPDKDKKMYKTFISTKKFGITEDKDYKYAYLWILSKGYYIDDNNKVVESTGSSMPYKFTFTKDNKLVDYQIPEDGKKYNESIKEMYPDKIEEEVLNYKPDQEELEKQVKDFYKDKK